MTTIEIVAISFIAGMVFGLIFTVWLLFFRKGNPWEQGYEDGYNARSEEIEMKTREQNKL